MRAALGAILALCLVAAPIARAAPLPPPRPASAEPQPSPPLATPPSPAEAAPAAPTSPTATPLACIGGLMAAGHQAEAVAQPSTDPACAIEEPVRLLAVANPAHTGSSGTGATITLPGAPIVACAFAARLATFLGEVAAPILSARLGQRLASVSTGPGFQCRPRNRQAGAKPSAHGRGLAIDIAGYALADGRQIGVRPSGQVPSDRALAGLRISACGWFTTVLGPGSDAFHADHVHLDLERHGSSDRYRICE